MERCGRVIIRKRWKALESVSWLMLVFLLRVSFLLPAPSFESRVVLVGSGCVCPGLSCLSRSRAWINTIRFHCEYFSGVAVTAVFAYGVCSRWVGSTLSVLIGFLFHSPFPFMDCTHPRRRVSRANMFHCMVTARKEKLPI